MSETRTMDDLSLDEKIRAGFAKPVGENALVPMASSSLSISDAIITAQKVDIARDDAEVLRKIKIFANAAGEDWFYRYPAKDNRSGKTSWIEGPSIKCANNVARLYGNCQIDTRVTDLGDSWLIYARFVDYESGFSYQRPFQQRKGQQSIGGKDAGRQLDIALQIGISKAIRNVVCNALETHTNFAFEEAKGAIVAKVGKDIEHYRERIVARFAELGIDLRRVETVMGRTAKEWLAPDLARIIAELQAVKDGMATIEESWPQLSDQEANRPTREQFQETSGANGEAQSSTSVQSYEVYDHTGVCTEVVGAILVGEVYVKCLEEAATAGPDAVKTVYENNVALVAALDGAGHGKLSKELGLIYAKVREEAEAKAAAKAKPETVADKTETQTGDANAEAQKGGTTPPAQQQPKPDPASSGKQKAATADSRGKGAPTQAPPTQAPPRSGFWTNESYTLPLTTKPSVVPDGGKLRDEILLLAEEAESVGEIDKLIADNDARLQQLQDFSAAMANEVRSTVAACRQRLEQAAAVAK